MKTRILITLISICVLIFTSCISNLDTSPGNKNNMNRDDILDVNESTINNEMNTEKSELLVDETKKYLEEDENVDVISFLENTDSDIDDVMTFESKDTDYNNATINTYLRERGLHTGEPDGLIKRGEVRLGEYYLNRNNEKIVFILRIWNHHVIPSKQVYILCITFELANKKEIGFIQYDFNENHKTIKEELYSEDRLLIADIEYEPSSLFPFSIIKEYNNYSNDCEHVPEVLNRNDKFWFFEDRMIQTDDGEPIGYIGDISYINQLEDFEANKDELSFNYDVNDRLIDIIGTLNNEVYYGEENQSETYDSRLNIKIQYSRKDCIDNIQYSKPALIYGSYDSIGEVLYDDRGRMIYNSYYVTHGSIEQFYFYRKNEVNPFICIKFDSMPQKGEVIDGVTFMYGNYTEVYIYDALSE